jgi:hypothetical protein
MAIDSGRWSQVAMEREDGSKVGEKTSKAVKIRSRRSLGLQRGAKERKTVACQGTRDGGQMAAKPRGAEVRRAVSREYHGQPSVLKNQGLGITM